jgi:anti-sigma regulatory factor (Ser/Thr protein kinase)
MKDTTLLTVPSHPRYLCVIRCVTGVMGQLCEMSPSVIEDVKLAVDEACTNVIKYAYEGRIDEKIVIEFRITEKGFEVIIEDNGEKAHPEFMKGRDLHDVRPGGLGLHLIKRAFDIFAFDDKKKTGNRLKLVRHLKKSEKEL